MEGSSFSGRRVLHTFINPFHLESYLLAPNQDGLAETYWGRGDAWRWLGAAETSHINQPHCVCWSGRNSLAARHTRYACCCYWGWCGGGGLTCANAAYPEHPTSRVRQRCYRRRHCKCRSIWVYSPFTVVFASSRSRQRAVPFR